MNITAHVVQPKLELGIKNCKLFLNPCYACNTQYLKKNYINLQSLRGFDNRDHFWAILISSR